MMIVLLIRDSLFSLNHLEQIRRPVLTSFKRVLKCLLERFVSSVNNILKMIPQNIIDIDRLLAGQERFL